MMDHRSARDNDLDVDLESGLPLLRDESKKASPSGTLNQGKTIFTKISTGLVGGSLRGEDRACFHTNESNSNQVSLDLLKVTNKPVMGQDLVNHEEKTPAREKRKKSNNKKAPKPPRPPQAPALDAADYKLIREISELAMLKRARIERMKALRKMKAAKSSLSSPSSSHSSILAMIFTIVFFLVIIFQGMSSGKGSVAGFQGSPLSTAAEGGLISVQYHLNPSASESNAPGYESHNYVQQVAGSDSAERPRRNSG